jgi:hypothetical protein
MTTRSTTLAMLGALACLGATAGAAPVPAPGYALRTIPTPDTVQGGVARIGNSVFVGQGLYGPGLQQIIRLDGTISATVADGFGSLGSFDVDGSGTLWAVDNCWISDFGCAASTTGDTLYAIPNAVIRLEPLLANSAEVLPSGSIGFPFDALVVPGAVLVSNSVGPGAGNVIEVAGGVPSVFASGFDYTASLALDGGAVYVGNSSATFVGSVRELDLTGAPQGTLVDGLAGAYGVTVDNAGNVLVSGVSAPDFSSSVVAVDPMGAVTERARGFAFSTDIFHDESRDATLVLDFGVSQITSICADADDDGICDADCTDPAAITKAKLKLTNVDAPPGDDGLTLSGEMTIPDVPAYDPVADGVLLAIDDADARVVVDVKVPAGAFDTGTKQGWKVNGAGNSWKWKSPIGVGGISTVVLKQQKSDPTQVKFKVVGKKAGYGGEGATLPLKVVFAVTPDSQCGAVDFATPPLSCLDTGTVILCR